MQIANKTPTIAVIVVNYNGAIFLPNCLNSLLNQTSPADRIIVVDNGSSDQSIQIISDSFTQVELVSVGENLGFAKANNLAINRIDNCEWIALVNPDTVSNADWLQNLRTGIALNPDVQMFSSRLVSMDNPEILDGAGDLYHVSGLVWRRGHGLNKIGHVSDQNIFSPCAAAALYQTSVVKELGGFDEAYFCYNEDIDLAFRMRLQGAKCLHLDQCEVMHAGSGITGKESEFTVYHGHRNLVWTFFKNMPGWLFWLYLPQHILMNLISILLYVKRGQAKTILRAKIDALKGLPRVLRQRRDVQARRIVSDYQIKTAMVTNPLAYLSRKRY